MIDDIDAVLARRGRPRELVLRVECLLADQEISAPGTALARVLPGPRPARTTVVAGFAVPGLLIELQVTAGVARLSA